MRPLLALLLASSASFAMAAPADYARQWPVLLPSAPAGAYAVEMTPEVYTTLQRADLRDLDVLDADGRPVPVAIVAQAATADTRRLALPWYRMPAPGGGGGDWRVIADVDAEGRLRGLRSTAARAADPVTTLLVDAGPLPQRPDALELEWRPGASFDAGYRIEGSDDFDTWYALGRGRLVDAREGARRLQVRRIALDAGGHHPRFLRLVPDDAGRALPGVTGVMAVWTSTPARPTEWRRLAPRAGADGAFEFDAGGPWPVRWIDLDGAGNDARAWRLQSRDSAQARWVDRAPHWVAYRVGTGRSPPRVFDRPVRDRHWRLLPQGGGDAPSLKLGHVPERVVFIAGGRAPYTLVAGSVRKQREARPVQVALDDAADAPATARLGASTQRAGSAALASVRDWRTWGLWAVLGLGVLAVGGFALRLLREPSRDPD